jgi:serine/threonine-protein kinase
MKQEALLGRTIAGKYWIESLVGQGAMGAVYKARQITLGTTLALKVLHGQLAGEPMFAARFLREAQAASRVDHPSSMRVVDFGEEPDGLLYIAMEYIDGKALAQILEEEGVLPVARIVDIACQALAALAVAHELGVIHRDIKPENLMVIEGKDDEGRAHDIVKVCDFGVAKLLEGGSRAPSVTAEGVVVGTPEYMSPEQARGETLDARSDLYSMGVLLFHMMTGKVPFDSSTAFGTAFMHVNDEPTRPRLLNPRVDSRLEKICLRAMRKRPDDRFASARELRNELRALVGHDDSCAEEPLRVSGIPLEGGLLAQMEARPRRTGLVLAGAFLAACAVAAYLLVPRLARPHQVHSAPLAAAPLPPPVPVPVAVPVPAKAPAAIAAAAIPVAAPPVAAPISNATSPATQPPVRAHAATRANARRAAGKTRNGASALSPLDAILDPAAPPPAAPPSASHADPAAAPLPNFPIPAAEPAP